MLTKQQLNLLTFLDEYMGEHSIAPTFDEMKNAFGSHPLVGEVRGDGMLSSLEFLENKDNLKFFDPAKKIGMQVSTNLLKEGVIGRAMPHGDILGFAPPLCLSKSEVNIIVDSLKKSIDSTYSNI